MGGGVGWAPRGGDSLDVVSCQDQSHQVGRSLVVILNLKETDGRKDLTEIRTNQQLPAKHKSSAWMDGEES